LEHRTDDDSSVNGNEPELLSDQIRNVLTDEIASGVLPPGMGLDEQNLADRFGASRTPVREALRQLAVTGLVEIRPRRGVIVTQTTPERIMEMFEMSAEIEAMCVRIATYRITPIERGKLIEMHDASEALVKRGDIDGYDKFNREFHEVIYGATHNAFMAETSRTLREQSLQTNCKPSRSRTLLGKEKTMPDNKLNGAPGTIRTSDPQIRSLFSGFT